MKPKSKIALHQLVTLLTKYLESSQGSKVPSLIEPLTRPLYTLTHHSGPPMHKVFELEA